MKRSPTTSVGDFAVRDGFVLGRSSDLNESSTVNQSSQGNSSSVDDERVDVEVVTAGGRGEMEEGGESDGQATSR